MSTIKKNKSTLVGKTIDELKLICKSHGYDNYRGEQLFNWIYKNYAIEFNSMINIPKKIRVFPSPQTVSLTVVGGIERIASLGSNDIEIIIDFKIWNNQTQFYEPQVIIPDDILSWKDISPKNLEIAVARELK